MTGKNPQPATAPKTGVIPAPKNESGELSETDLNKVSGGVKVGVNVTEDPCQGGQLHKA